LWIKLIMVIPVTAVFYGAGLILFAFYQVHGDPLAAGAIHKADQILPYFVVTELPAGFPGLLIAAIYAASMSTISAGINSLTSASLVDFYQRLWPQSDLSERTQLKLARRLTLLYGALVIAFAFLVQHLGTLLEASNSVIGLVGGPLLGLFFLGTLVRRVTARGALVGWLAGCLAGVGALLPSLLPDGLPDYLPESLAGAAALLRAWLKFDISFLWYTLIGCGATMIAGYLASLFEPPPDRQKLQRLVWKGRRASDETPA
jgi:sodium-coupled monocarboxylate transporter 8/12